MFAFDRHDMLGKETDVVMKRIGDILADLATAHESEIGRLLAEARLATQRRQGIAAGMTDRGVHHPRAKGRHGDKATLARAGELGKDGTNERPAKFQGGVVNATTKRGRRGRSGVNFRVIVNPALDTMPKCGRTHLAAERAKPPLGVRPHLRIVVSNW